MKLQNVTGVYAVLFLALLLFVGFMHAGTRAWPVPTSSQAAGGKLGIIENPALDQANNDFHLSHSIKPQKTSIVVTQIMRRVTAELMNTPAVGRSVAASLPQS